MTVVFHSDGSNQHSGFRANLDTSSYLEKSSAQYLNESLSVSPRVGTQYLTDDSGAFVSPNFPTNYDNNLVCTWKISTTKNIIQVHINYMHTASNDYLSFYDGYSTSSSLIRRFPKQQQSPMCNRPSDL